MPKNCSFNCPFCYLRDISEEVNKTWVFDLTEKTGIERELFYSDSQKLYKGGKNFLEYHSFATFVYNDALILDPGDMEVEDLDVLVSNILDCTQIASFATSHLNNIDKFIYLRVKYGDRFRITLDVPTLWNYNKFSKDKAHTRNMLFDKLREAIDVFGTLNYTILVNPKLADGWANILQETELLLKLGLRVKWNEMKLDEKINEAIGMTELEYLMTNEFGKALLAQYGSDRFSPMSILPGFNIAVDRVLSGAQEIQPDEILITSPRIARIFAKELKDIQIMTVQNKALSFAGDHSSASLIVNDDLLLDSSRRYVIPKESVSLMSYKDGQYGTDLLGKKFPENVRFI